VQECAADDPHFLEGGYTPIDGDEIAGTDAEIVVNLLDADRQTALYEHGQNPESRLRDAKAGGL